MDTSISSQGKTSGWRRENTRNPHILDLLEQLSRRLFMRLGLRIEASPWSAKPETSKKMRIPEATYRLQLSAPLDFKAVRAIVPYLSKLGVSDIYASPILKPRTGSSHGYDVVDPARLNEELGDREDLRLVANVLQQHGMGWIQDIVPNHMAFHRENLMLMDVLEKGPNSRFIDFFDIDWDHTQEGIKGRVLAPFLGKHFGAALEDGEIQLTFGPDGLQVSYYEMKLPVRLGSYERIFSCRIHELKRRLGEDHPDYIKLLGVLYMVRSSPPTEDCGAAQDRSSFVKRLLWELYTQSPIMRDFVLENLSVLNGEKGNPRSFAGLEELLSEQFYRLSYWKVAADEINYRRFFSVNELISLNIHLDEVFDHTHAFILKLIRSGLISGLRIDHVDGLQDPTRYLKRLRKAAPETYLLVEKILASEEELTREWPVQGTTGYDFLATVNGVFCETTNEKAFTEIYHGITGSEVPFEELVRRNKQIIISEDMAGDVYNLAQLVKRIADSERHGQDLTMYGLQRAVREVLSAFPVYRTYLSSEYVPESDRTSILRSVETSRARRPSLANELDFIERFLCLQFPDYLAEDQKQQWLHFVMRFQQCTGPLMAKGFEDTVFYNFNRLVSLNDVGGNPGVFGFSLKKFHDFNLKRQALWPHAMNATSTHDTKRGEDVRARLNVLSEIPEEWDSRIRNWVAINSNKKKRVRDREAPDKNDEYHLYQTLVGAFPFNRDEYPAFVERIKTYVVKAVREAKVHTAWLKPDNEYEDAFVSFARAVLESGDGDPFFDSFLPFQRKVAHYGVLNSLSQTLIKVTSPGVPDFYQGTELWDLTLVDPDNRRPVDFPLREGLLEEIMERTDSGLKAFIAEVLANPEDGRVKMFLTTRLLKIRSEFPELFRDGTYSAVQAGGTLGAHLVTFKRSHGKHTALILAPRFFTSLVPEGCMPLGQATWKDTFIQLGIPHAVQMHNVLTDTCVTCAPESNVGEILEEFPVALLIGETLK